MTDKLIPSVEPPNLSENVATDLMQGLPLNISLPPHLTLGLLPEIGSSSADGPDPAEHLLQRFSYGHKNYWLLYRSLRDPWVLPDQRYLLGIDIETNHIDLLYLSGRSPVISRVGSSLVSVLRCTTRYEAFIDEYWLGPAVSEEQEIEAYHRFWIDIAQILWNTPEAAIDLKYWWRRMFEDVAFINLALYKRIARTFKHNIRTYQTY